MTFSPVPKTRGLSKSQESIEDDAKAAYAWEKVKQAVEARDGDRCRVCQKRCKFGAGTLSEKADPHHVMFASAGGPDATWNVVKLCRSCHDDAHVHRKIALSGNADDLDELGRARVVRLERLTESGWEVVGLI